jgi:YlmC/YmxH family sporulation protein
MELSMYSIANLRNMEVIEITSGAKLGFIKDIKVDCSEYKILSLLLPNQKMSWFSKNDFLEIPWEKVLKVGIDVILVEAGEVIINNKE